MTDLAAAFADTSTLTPFDGKPVRRTTIAVTNAGDGLSNALKVDPKEFHHGEKLYVVLECEVAKVGFVPLTADEPDLARVHTLRAMGATIVDADLVKTHLDEQAERILLAKEAAAGVARIEFPDGEEFGPGTMPGDDELAGAAGGVEAGEVTGNGSGHALDEMGVDADGFADPAIKTDQADEMSGKRAARRAR